MARNRRPTQRLIESKEQNSRQDKKQKQKQILQKRISKAQVNLVKEVAKPRDNSKELEVIRDTNNNKLYNGLKVDLKENLTILIRLTLQEFPKDFLPDIFKGIVPLYIEQTPVEIKQTVLLSKLANGDYHTATSKSDKNIASGIKTLLKIPELQKYDKDDLTDFVRNHREVFYHILVKAKNEKLSFPTLKGYVVRLMRVLVIALKTKNTPVYIKYASLMKDMIATGLLIDDKNELNELEKGRFVDFRYIMDKQKELNMQFNAIENKQTKKAYDLNLDLVLVSLYTLTPPLRREPMNLKFRENKDTIEHDFVHIRRKDVKLELNLDKKRHDPIVIDCNQELADILRQSYELYPRRDVFTMTTKFPNLKNGVKEDAVANRLKRIFKYTEQEVGVSMLRSSYITYRFDEVNWRLPMSEVKEIAKLMRTSSTYILSSYRKIINNPDAVQVKKVNIKKEPVEEPKIKKEDPYKKHIETIKKKYADNEEYRQKTLQQQGEYRQKLGQSVIQKRKVLSMLRNSEEYRKKVKQTTLDKYGIKPEDYM